MQRTGRESADTHRVVALLRAVNVGGRAVLRMAELKTLLAELGYDAPQTLLQSGNAVFGVGGARRETSGAIEARIERELERRLSLRSDVFIRSAGEWDAAIAANPFREEAESDPSRLVIMPLKDAPPAAAVKALQASIKGREAVRADGRQLYIVYPDGIGTSKLTSSVIERTLGSRGTARNWNTALKLAALAQTGH
jgi:uncharacterized protein (DUF1697 family)